MEKMELLQKKYPDLVIQKDIPLAPYTTLRVGGKADYLLTAEEEDTFCGVLRFLKENENCGHIVSHLPCRLMIRASAPIEECSQAASDVAAPQELSLKYFSGEAAQNIMKVEAILQAGDELNRQIVLGLMEGKSAEAIAKALFLSTRAVRYRITNLVKRHGFSDKSALMEALNNANGTTEI